MSSPSSYLVCVHHASSTSCRSVLSKALECATTRLESGQTFCPLEISSAAISTWPSVVTTSRGIRGACRKISVPTQPNIATENTNIAIKICQSFLIRNRSFTSYPLRHHQGWTICKASILARFNIGVCVQTHISAPCRQTCFVLSLVSPGETLLLGSLVSILSSLCDSVILYVCWRETCTFDLF